MRIVSTICPTSSVAANVTGIMCNRLASLETRKSKAPFLHFTSRMRNGSALRTTNRLVTV